MKVKIKNSQNDVILHEIIFLFLKKLHFPLVNNVLEYKLFGFKVFLNYYNIITNVCECVPTHIHTHTYI